MADRRPLAEVGATPELPEPPAEYTPTQGQVPAFVRTDEQLRRWRWCWAVCLAFYGFVSPVAVRDLYFSDIPIDPEPDSAGEDGSSPPNEHPARDGGRTPGGSKYEGPRLLAMLKPSKPISAMSDQEIEVFAEQLSAVIRTRLHNQPEPRNGS